MIVAWLDPDLAASRSLSLDARVRLQAERNVERDLASEEYSLRQRLEEYLRQLNGAHP